MRKLLLFGGVMAALCILPATASADWFDDFDSYAAGSAMHGQGNWVGWDNDPNVSGNVSNAQQRSLNNSQQILLAQDMVREYSGYTSGKWTYTAWVYIPNSYQENLVPQYFILLNEYNHGAGILNNWSVQMSFGQPDDDFLPDGKIHADLGTTDNVTAMDYLVDEWGKITVNIDLDADWCQVYYNDVLLDDPTLDDHPILGGGYQWTLGVFGQDTDGFLDIAAVDLYGNTNIHGIYYDDMSLTESYSWVDDIKIYQVGSDLHGQGGWAGWDNNPAAGALVTNAQAHSGANSIDINGGSDLVYEFEGYNSGIVTFTAWHYIPTGFTGTNYFIMLNQYDPGGTQSWSVQFYFDGTMGSITGGFGGGTYTFPWQFGMDQWLELNVVVYMDDDWCQILYNDVVLDDPGVADHPTLGGGYTWSLGPFGNNTTGITNIGALDLYAAGASTIYYDDISISPGVPSLKCDTEFIDETVATQATFVINAGFENAGRNYIILPGVTGTEPGLPLPKGLVTMPLNWDAFTNLIIPLLNTPAFTNFFGQLDYMGNATAVFDTIIPQSGLAGMNMYFAATINNPYDWVSSGHTIRFF